MSKESLDIQGSSGQSYWRSLEELSQSAEFRARLEREFPREAAELRDPVSRRSFLKLMGASMALSSLVGCQFALKQPQEKIVPYVRQPEQVIPGRSLYFATSMTVQGYGIGLLAESHEGRPTKVEGNAFHPASRGSSDAWIQASVLTMYDPDRSQQILKAGQPASWEDAFTALGSAYAQAGSGLRILTEPTASPSLVATIQEVVSAGAKWYQYDALSGDNTRAGAQAAFGSAVNTIYAFDKADVVVALDSDFTHGSATSIRYAQDVASKRRITSDEPVMSRIYVAEPTPSNTGALADHRLAVKSGDIAAVTQAIAAAVGVSVAAPTLPEATQKWVATAVADLQAATGKSVVIAGETQPAAVHALVHAINAALANVGSTVNYTAPIIDADTGAVSLKALVDEINAGAVSMLVIADVNVVYSAPADLNMAEALKKVPTVVHLGLYNDETAAAATWHIHATHYLESWGDTRAYNGVVSLQQPLIAPLYDGKHLSEVLNALTGKRVSAHDTVKGHWQAQLGLDGFTFDKAWQTALHDGIVAGASAIGSTPVTLGTVSAAAGASSDGLELIFRADPSLRDGSAANNGWLQEVPKPFSKLVWDNSAQVSPETASKLGVKTEDVVTLTINGRSVEAPINVVPGQANDTVVVHLGFGRTQAGKVGNGVGFNSYALRSSDAMWVANGVTVSKTDKTYKLATTQSHYNLEGRDFDILHAKTLAEYLEEKKAGVKHKKHEIYSLFPAYDYSKGYQWGMTIDLNACNGCNACVVACQAENNIPVVGKEEIWRGREMQWIRIDTYFSGDSSNPTIYQQPIACMQCEHAPCEIVCPVAATVHDSEGINNMVYNRCVGTKYCSNNCPYKVRRFNFFQYADEETPSLKLQRNPDVTVRVRGVMEKCNYCLQRINEARIDATREDRVIQDGEVVTACQQACPSQAIVFGNINDTSSQVAKLKALETKFTVLDSLNTKPRTSYMIKFTNSNPELSGKTE